MAAGKFQITDRVTCTSRSDDSKPVIVLFKVVPQEPDVLIGVPMRAER